MTSMLLLNYYFYLRLLNSLLNFIEQLLWWAWLVPLSSFLIKLLFLSSILFYYQALVEIFRNTW